MNRFLWVMLSLAAAAGVPSLLQPPVPAPPHGGNLGTAVNDFASLLFLPNTWSTAEKTDFQSPEIGFSCRSGYSDHRGIVPRVTFRSGGIR